MHNNNYKMNEVNGNHKACAQFKMKEKIPILLIEFKCAEKKMNLEFCARHLGILHDINVTKSINLKALNGIGILT